MTFTKEMRESRLLCHRTVYIGVVTEATGPRF